MRESEVGKSRVLGSQGHRGEPATARCHALLCASAIHNSVCRPRQPGVN